MMTRTSKQDARQMRFDRTIGLAALLTIMIALLIAGLASSAAAATVANAASQRVALIPQAGPLPAQGANGIMPTSSFVSGRASESFSRFSFHNLALNEVTTANLANYDTIALIQVSTAALTASEKAAIAGFVAHGGKLIIHDADETKANDYSWLLPDGALTKVGQGCNNCGSSSGKATIGTNNVLISGDPLDPSYVNLEQLYEFTDQGDANLLVSSDPRWFNLVQGTNGRGESGSVMAFAQHNGLIIYDGFDTDFIKSNPGDPWRCNDVDLGFACPPPPAPQPTVDWLAQIWYSELALGWSRPGPSSGGGDAGLPTNVPTFQVGSPLSSGSSGLPGAGGVKGRCERKAGPVLQLQSLLHLWRRTVVRVDVYINGRHVLIETRPFTSRTLRIPRGRNVTVIMVATTKRGYHLVAKRRYHRC